MIKKYLTGVLISLPVLAGCAEMQIASHFYKKTINNNSPAPYAAPPIRQKRKVGKPYIIEGKTYYPISSSEGYRAKGIASWYGRDFHGKKTANGERYNMYDLTAAHPTLPLPTYVRVTNLENMRSIMLRVNDRGPFKRNRLIDLSYRAAEVLGMAEQGTAPVMVEALPTDGSALRPATWGTRLASGAPPGRSPVVRQKPRPQKSHGSFTTRIAGKEAREETFTEEHSLPAQKIRTVKNRLHNVDIYIQTGAFSNPSNASSQKKKVEQVFYQSYPIHLMETDKNGQRLHRVRVGPIDNVEEADQVLAKLVRQGFNTAIIVVD